MWTGCRKSIGILAEQSFGEYKDVFHWDYWFFLFYFIFFPLF